jgi:hypothetical protein
MVRSDREIISGPPDGNKDLDMVGYSESGRGDSYEFDKKQRRNDG